MLRRELLGGFVLTALGGWAAPGQAQVSVNIGIHLGAPPRLVPVPATAVAYAPGVGGNYFFYGGQYYVFTRGVWYAARGYNGPWVVLAPEYVPRPILAVPVRYYRVPPPGWRRWRHDVAPHWDARWGRRWEEHREGRREGRWDRREDRWDRREDRWDRREDRRERHEDRR